MDSSSLPFVMFQAVSPKQWTTWVYFYHVFERSVLNNGQLESIFYCFKWSVLNNGQLEFTFIFQKVSSPASSENEMSLNPSHHYQISFPALSEHGISMFIPRFVGTRNIKRHSPFVGWRNVKSVIPVCLVQRCHQSKCLFLQTISLQIHFKFPNTTINTVVDNHSSPVELQYSLAESDPFLQRIRVSLLFQNKSSLSFYIHNYIMSIHNILSQKWCTYI